ncbi:hypothetical protein FB107DRAFT_279284 [Schizophyllum commune]
MARRSCCAHTMLLDVLAAGASAVTVGDERSACAVTPSPPHRRVDRPQNQPLTSPSTNAHHQSTPNALCSAAGAIATAALTAVVRPTALHVPGLDRTSHDTSANSASALGRRGHAACCRRSSRTTMSPLPMANGLDVAARINLRTVLSSPCTAQTDLKA